MRTPKHQHHESGSDLWEWAAQKTKTLHSQSKKPEPTKLSSVLTWSRHFLKNVSGPTRTYSPLPTTLPRL
ncbi:MAG: hypothetical protein ABIP97_14390 [Chthoniobacterales bacterium]